MRRVYPAPHRTPLLQPEDMLPPGEDLPLLLLALWFAR